MLLLMYAGSCADIGVAREAQGQSTSAQGSVGKFSDGTGGQAQNVSSQGLVSTPPPQSGGGSSGGARQSSLWMSAAVGGAQAHSARAIGGIGISLQARTGAIHGVRARASVRDTEMQLFEEMLMTLVAEMA